MGAFIFFFPRWYLVFRQRDAIFWKLKYWGAETITKRLHCMTSKTLVRLDAVAEKNDWAVVVFLMADNKLLCWDAPFYEAISQHLFPQYHRFKQYQYAAHSAPRWVSFEEICKENAGLLQVKINLEWYDLGVVWNVARRESSHIASVIPLHCNNQSS